MINRSSSQEEIQELVKSCLVELYDKEKVLFDRRNYNGLREECLTFRFAHRLQNKIGEDFFVDFEYDASYNQETGEQYSEKKLKDSDGNESARLVDIIVHTRKTNRSSDFICFEIKKSRNRRKSAYQKDIDNLADLTHTYGYLFGFHIILGKKLSETKWKVFIRRPERTRHKISKLKEWLQTYQHPCPE